MFGERKHWRPSVGVHVLSFFGGLSLPQELVCFGGDKPETRCQMSPGGVSGVTVFELDW